jgi:branched-chain amino acid transport system substrate-binding protein
MRKRAIIPFAVATAAALVLSACSGGGGAGSPSGSASGSPIIVGVINPLSGATAQDAGQVNNGYQLAADQTNAKGGVNGHPINLVFGDAGTADQGTTTAQRLITNENAKVLVGTYVSAVSDTASQTAARYNIPYWETNALSDSLTTRGLKNYFRVGINATYMGGSVSDAIPLLEKQTGKDIKNTTVYITHEDSIYGTSVAAAQQAALTAAGATVVDNIPYSASATDLTAPILKGKQDNADVWMQTGYTNDDILIFRTAQAQNWRPSVIWGGTGGSALSSGVGADWLNGVLSSDYPQDLNQTFGPGSDQFLADYKAKYGSEPTLPQALTAYSGFLGLVSVLQKTGGDPTLSAFSTAALGLDEPASTYPTGAGIKFDGNQQNTRASIIVDQWQSGVQKTVFPPAAVPAGNAVIPSKR